MKKAVALIVKEPLEIYLDFLAEFVSYDIYIIVDSDKDLTKLTKIDKYRNLNFVQLSDQHCVNHGFQNVNFMGIKKLISGWDKALLFFSVIIPLKYEHIWFIEDDVFFLNEQVLINLDLKYPNQDLIANCDFDKTKVTEKYKRLTYFDWVWKQIDIKIERPWYAGMMCATRISKMLLQGIRWYATKYKTLFFLEALIPTITSHFKLSHVQPNELTTVSYRDVFFEEKDDDRLATNIFHPMKDLNKHKEIRNKEFFTHYIN